MTTMTLEPHDLAAESCLVGSALLSPNTVFPEVEKIVTAEDLYDHRHRLVYETALRMWLDGDPVDPQTVRVSLERSGDLARAGGPVFLLDLIQAPPTAANVTFYADQVADMADRRKVLAQAVRIQQLAVQGHLTGPDLVATAQDMMLGVDARRGFQASKPMDLLVPKRLSLLEKIRSGEYKEVLIPTGFSDLDRYLRGGIRPGQLIMIAARPAVGKSVFAFDIARHVGLHLGLPVLYFALEMSEDEMTDRLISAESGVPLDLLTSPDLRPDQADKINAVAARVRSKAIYLNDQAGQTIASITAEARSRQRTQGLGLIVVDYLGLVESVRRSENRQEEVAAISRGLKNLAKSIGVPVIAVAQLNRNLQARADKRPMLTDLRESGSLEQDADAVLFLHREDYYNPHERISEIDVIVAKNRGGETGDITFIHQFDRARIVQFAHP